jgi:hypothetical protein
MHKLSIGLTFAWNNAQSAARGYFIQTYLPVSVISYKSVQKKKFRER